MQSNGIIGEDKERTHVSKPRILYFDLETLPAVVVSFDLFKPVFSPEHILEHPRIAGFSYMWHGWKRARWSSEFHHPEGKIGRASCRERGEGAGGHGAGR